MNSGRHRGSGDLPCPNPFCDGYGAIDISPLVSGLSWEFDACTVGPHPIKVASRIEDRLRATEDVWIKGNPAGGYAIYWELLASIAAEALIDEMEGK